MAARLLARRPMTTSELHARLVAMGYQERTASRVVARAVELRWLDDETLAHDRARSLRARGAGPLRIAADLEARGLPAALVDAAVEASRNGRSEDEWAEQALGAAGLVERLSAPRAWRLLVQRGFPEDVVARLLDLDTSA
ncbi:MAG TPA: regulatory protein RecX [Candidatus Limnocylindria bacterium]|nr:regulatory protein RecX [Candidatus Limnocylindria bacterium]